VGKRGHGKNWKLVRIEEPVLERARQMVLWMKERRGIDTTVREQVELAILERENRQKNKWNDGLPLRTVLTWANRPKKGKADASKGGGSEPS